jgi:hypothetical protein
MGCRLALSLLLLACVFSASPLCHAIDLDVGSWLNLVGLVQGSEMGVLWGVELKAATPTPLQEVSHEARLPSKYHPLVRPPVVVMHHACWGWVSMLCLRRVHGGEAAGQLSLLHS